MFDIQKILNTSKWSFVSIIFTFDTKDQKRVREKGGEKYRERNIERKREGKRKRQIPSIFEHSLCIVPFIVRATRS